MILLKIIIIFQDYNLPYDIKNGKVPISGLFNLEPLHASYLNATFICHQMKVCCIAPYIMPQLDASYSSGRGREETNKFKRQSIIYNDKFRDKGFEVSCLKVGTHDHVGVVGD